MMSSITPNTPRAEPEAPGSPTPPLGTRRAPGGGFWSFLKTLFVGTAGLAVLGVVGALAGSAWLTANQRAEAEKPQPWADPSFTTTAVTTGGMLARWMDNDGVLENGHSYIKGIYDLWKTRHQSVFAEVRQQRHSLPQLWQKEVNIDIDLMAAQEQKQRALTESTIARQNTDTGVKAADAFVKQWLEKNR